MDKELTKKELDLLEKIFKAEINGALNGGIQIYQTKSKLAKKLLDEGLIKKVSTTLNGQFPVTIEGYMLTLFGNLSYCMSDRCSDEAIEKLK